ncbi:MAG: ketoacyl-ACP synthase III [Parvularculaceae bacterium]
MTVLRSVVCGVGGYLPEKILTNEEISRIVETSDEWIRERTGIRERRIAADNERTSDLAAAAARQALERAQMTPEDIELIIVATATPDLTFPATATIVQAKLGVRAGAAFDIQAVCTGFVYALATADKFLKSGQYASALVIGAETFSRILDWTDRTTCVLFGDGAGAVALRAEEGTGGLSDRGVLADYLRADGRHVDMLYVDGGPSSTGSAGHLRMQGNQVYRRAVEMISEAVEQAAQIAGVGLDEIDWFVPHQANKRIIDAVARRLGISPESVVETVSRHGNTSAASVPLALNEAYEDGRLKRGDLVMIEAMGGGLTWGASLFRF